MNTYEDLKQNLIHREETKDYSGYNKTRNLRRCSVSLESDFYSWLISNQANSFVQNMLGEMHYQNKQFEKATKWYLKSIEQGNKWSYYDLGWIIMRGKSNWFCAKEGIEFYYKSVVPEFTNAIYDFIHILQGIRSPAPIEIDDQRHIYNLCQMHCTLMRLGAQEQCISILDKKEFDIINSELDNKYKHPQTIGEWHKMNTEYIKKHSFIHVYDTILTIPKELVLLIIGYI